MKPTKESNPMYYVYLKNTNRLLFKTLNTTLLKIYQPDQVDVVFYA